MIVNRKELAELFDVKGDTLDRWVELGMPVERRVVEGVAGRPRELHRLVDCKDARGRYVQRTGVRGSAQRERLLRAQAEAKETANKVRAGELIEHAQAAAEVLEGVLIARDRLLTIPGRVAPRIAAMVDIEAIEVFLTAEMEQEMTLLAARAEAL